MNTGDTVGSKTEQRLEDCVLRNIEVVWCRNPRSSVRNAFKYGIDMIFDALCDYIRNMVNVNVYMCVCDHNEVDRSSPDSRQFLCNPIARSSIFDLLIKIESPRRGGKVRRKFIRLEAKLYMENPRNVSIDEIETKLDYSCCGETVVKKIVVVFNNNIKRGIKSIIEARKEKPRFSIATLEDLKHGLTS